METSILISIKKKLNVDASYTIFDQDIIMHINGVFSILNQLGVGPITGFAIEDDSAAWDDLMLPLNQLSLVKSFIYLKTRLLFDPPGTSFHINAVEALIAEYEWRLRELREATIPSESDVDGVLIVDGGNI